EHAQTVPLGREKLSERCRRLEDKLLRIAAWETVGFTVGRMEWQNGRERFRFDLDDRPGDLVFFEPTTWGPTTGKPLPQHSQPFGLDLGDCLLTDKDLICLTRLKKLQALRFNCSRVTPEGLKHLASFEELSELYVCGDELTGESLKTLARLKSVR